MSRPFRIGDIVTVYNFHYARHRQVKGRVICVNRKSKYDMPIVVLCDCDGSEMIETFKEDGSRYLKESTCRITLGWKPDA